MLIAYWFLISPFQWILSEMLIILFVLYLLIFFLFINFVFVRWLIIFNFWLVWLVLKWLFLLFKIIFFLANFILLYFLKINLFFKLLISILINWPHHILLSFDCVIYLMKVFIIWSILWIIINRYICIYLLIVFVYCYSVSFEMILIWLVHLFLLRIFKMRISVGINLYLLSRIFFDLISLSKA